MALARLKSVAGVTIPDTALCCAAVDLLECSSPEWLRMHCLRTYVLGSLAVRGLGRSVVEVDGANAAREFCAKHRLPPERADVIWQAIALHTSPGIPIRLADEIALVHLGAGLDFLGFGLDQVPSRLVEELLEIYPRMNFKAKFRNLLIEHCRHNPAAQVLTWTDDVARTAGCTLHGQPIPTASQIMLAARFDE